MTIPPAAHPDLTQPYPSAPAPLAGSNGIGRAALIVAIVAVALSVTLTLGTIPLFRSTSPLEHGILNAIDTYLPALIGLVAAILGMIGISRPQSPKVAAAIATGAGATLALGAVASSIFSALLTIRYI